MIGPWAVKRAGLIGSSDQYVLPVEPTEVPALCGHRVPTEARFCPRCGARLAAGPGRFGAFADAETTPVFIYDRDGSRLGSLWMAHRVLNEKVTLSQAKSEAESLGFHYEKTATLDPVRKALDKLLPAF